MIIGSKQLPSHASLSLDTSATMSTLEEELLNDFADSGSEGEAEQQNGLLNDEATPTTNGTKERFNGLNEMDVDEEEDLDGDDDMDIGGLSRSDAYADADDEEEAKAKVERMQFGGVKDVQSVAKLMKTSEPVLEVCLTTPGVLMKLEVYIYCVNLALMFCVSSRKSHTFNHYHLTAKPHLLVISRTIRSMPSLPSLILCRSLSIMKLYSYISLFEIIILSDSLN